MKSLLKRIKSATPTWVKWAQVILGMVAGWNGLVATCPELLGLVPDGTEPKIAAISILAGLFLQGINKVLPPEVNDLKNGG